MGLGVIGFGSGLRVGLRSGWETFRPLSVEGLSFSRERLWFVVPRRRSRDHWSVGQFGWVLDVGFGDGMNRETMIT